MKFSLIQLFEGGNATKEWGTQRVTRSDLDEVLTVVSKALQMDKKELADNLLGSARVLYMNKKKDAGDIDFAFSKYKKQEIHNKMKSLTNNQSVYNTGTKIGSYAVEVKGGKKVQVDFMFVDSPDFAKFMYYSAEGVDSQYPGAVRNIMLMTLVTFIREEGKDFVSKNEEGDIIARASRSLKLDTGLERLFKVAKKRKDGEGRVKSLEKVSPEELEKELKEIDPSVIGKFEKTPDVISDPEAIAHFLFGKGTSAKNIMTAENVARLINKKFSGEELKKIKEKIKEVLTDSDLPVPKEL
jgi:hypothetical protein